MSSACIMADMRLCFLLRVYALEYISNWINDDIEATDIVSNIKTRFPWAIYATA